MYLLLNGPDRQELRDVLQSTFDRDGLRMALAESEPSRNYESLVKADDFAAEVFELIGVAEQGGWLDELIALIPLRTKREDLRGRAQAVLQRAQEREKRHGDGQGAIRGLQLRFLLLTVAFFAFGALSLALGLMAYLFAPHIGIWSIPTAVVALVTMIAAAVLYRRDEMERTDLVQSPLPLIFLALVVLASAINGVALLQSAKAEPNAVLILTDNNVPVANQKVRLKPPAKDEGEEQVTNANGEAFFTLLFGRFYIGEFQRERQGEICQTPSILAEERGKSFPFDIGKLCSATGPGLDEDILRTDSGTRTPSVATDGLDLPENPIARRERAPLGYPNAPLILDRRYYSVGFDAKLRAALWVAFIVDEAKTIMVPRTPDQFVPDPALPIEIQTSTEDYARNPYDRGTLIRRADAGYGAKTLDEAKLAERETFYLSIVVPQPDNTNRVTWREVEQLTGELSKRHGMIHVFAGPVYKSVDSQGSFLVVGPGRTLVPQFLYRVLLRKAADQKWRAIGFVVPNDGSTEKDPTVFLTSVANIEARTGLKFFPELSASEQAIKDNSKLAVFSE